MYYNSHFVGKNIRHKSLPYKVTLATIHRDQRVSNLKVSKGHLANQVKMQILNFLNKDMYMCTCIRICRTDSLCSTKLTPL